MIPLIEHSGTGRLTVQKAGGWLTGEEKRDEVTGRSGWSYSLSDQAVVAWVY